MPVMETHEIISQISAFFLFAPRQFWIVAQILSYEPFNPQAIWLLLWYGLLCALEFSLFIILAGWLLTLLYAIFTKRK
jgi:hypothetical protein